MKAIIFDRHGDSDVLGYRDVERPSPGAGEVLVAVRAVSVNHGPDVETRQRGFSMGAVEMPHIGGVDPAGEIAEVGPGVTGWRPGDRVAVYPVIACGVCEFCRDGFPENYCSNSRLYGVQTQGGRAQFAVAPASQLVPLPDNVSYEAAAALGVAYTTTWHGMNQRARLTANDTLLVMGAGGGCGVAAVQLGKLVGARVLAVTGSEWKQQRVRELGADEVFSYRDPDWAGKVRAATGGRGVTAAFDNAGSETLPSSVDCLARAGRLFCSGGTTGFEVMLDVRQLYRNLISLYFYVQGSKADMAELVGFVADGKLDPVVDSRYPLRAAAEADDKLSSQDHFGRIVLTVEGSE
ncbi:alcohol dehydrogenase catalytic domain-containing protein [Amycolatopsis jejuensis]|uniref:alcohol dehydrogenase catalytic domain-containing protein n=1 Tax=Amycolatopsis jejuensis TaxID=330084 RepID=UPI0005279D29|nr:alcohol dehydrogenase catalytic domain-containing protein [Amycolatopsis jejuensis]